MSVISGYLVDNQSHEEFDYNEWWTKIEERLVELGVFRDLAGEIDAAELRDRERETGQMELPLRQSAGEMDLDYGLSESRTLQRWHKLIR
jgi:hypothetical protein